MAAADPLAGLRGYDLPEPISWWPPAPGWWLLLALLALLGLLAALRYRRARRQRRPSSLAARELALLQRRYRNDGDALAYLRGLSELLRRFALARFPGESVAGLCGEAWLRFLASKDDGDAFTQGAGRCLAEAPYRSAADLDIGAVEQLVAGWIRRNREAGA